MIHKKKIATLLLAVCLLYYGAKKSNSVTHYAYQLKQAKMLPTTQYGTLLSCGKPQEQQASYDDGNNQKNKINNRLSKKIVILVAVGCLLYYAAKKRNSILNYAHQVKQTKTLPPTQHDTLLTCKKLYEQQTIHDVSNQRDNINNILSKNFTSLKVHGYIRQHYPSMPTTIMALIHQWYREVACSIIADRQHNEYYIQLHKPLDFFIDWECIPTEADTISVSYPKCIQLTHKALFLLSSLGIKFKYQGDQYNFHLREEEVPAPDTLRQQLKVKNVNYQIQQKFDRYQLLQQQANHVDKYKGHILLVSLHVHKYQNAWAVSYYFFGHNNDFKIMRTNVMLGVQQTNTQFNEFRVRLRPPSSYSLYTWGPLYWSIQLCTFSNYTDDYFKRKFPGLV